MDSLTRYCNWCARTKVINGQTKSADVWIQQEVVDETTLVVVYLENGKRLGRKNNTWIPTDDSIKLVPSHMSANKL